VRILDPESPTPVVIALFVASIGLCVLVGFLGASTAVPPLRTEGLLPPYSITALPSQWIVLAMLLLALGLGVLQVLIGLRAMRRGWRPPLRKLAVIGALGAAAFVLVPPMGSADYTNYSAYGHIQNSGLDAYSVTPVQATQLSIPTAAAVERPWTKTPSVYGPASVRLEQFAAWIGGPSLTRTSLIFTLIHCLAFVATGAILIGLAKTERGKARAVVMWMANPLMIYQLVASSHVDAIVVLLIVAGFALLRRSRFAAGFLVGVGIATKVNAALAGLGMAWADRRSPRRLVALACGALLAVVGLYATVSSHSLDQTS
jgi:hypothetical protein